MEKISLLSSIDHIFTGIGSYPIEFIFVYNKRINENKLKESLQKTLGFFPMIASKLLRYDEHTYAFELSPDGLILEVLESQITFEENDEKYNYINPVDTREGNPLTKIKLTHTPHGSVLGISISHSIADGFSYFHFLSSWARIFHGKQIFPPIHQRQLLISKEPTEELITQKEVFDRAGLFMDNKRTPVAKKDLKWKTKFFANEELKDRLSKAQIDCDLRLSYNDIITALLAKEFLPDWTSNDSEEICYISCPVDFRRIEEGFPKTYFGNAVVLASKRMEYKTLENISLSDLAGIIRSNVGKVNDIYIDQSVSVLASLRKQKNPEIFEYIHVMHPRTGLLITNLSRLPVHEIEFNAGPPIKYDILTQSVRGAVILPGQDGLEARICCPVN